MPRVAPGLGEGRALTFVHRTFWMPTESSGRRAPAWGGPARGDRHRPGMDGQADGRTHLGDPGYDDGALLPRRAQLQLRGLAQLPDGDLGHRVRAIQHQQFCGGEGSVDCLAKPKLCLRTLGVQPMPCVCELVLDGGVITTAGKQTEDLSPLGGF